MSDTEGSGASRAAEFGNEDAYLVSDELGLYVVCDGASGGPAGALAASIAIEALEGFVADAEAEHGPVLTSEPISHPFADSAVRHAIGAVLEAAQHEPELQGMSTTLSMLLALGGRAVIGHTGDSRVYRIRERRLSQLTRDHRHTEALSSAPLEGRGSSGEEAPIVETFAIELRRDDVYVLCTDGAVEAVKDRGLVRNAHDLSPGLLASRIVSLAHRMQRDADATAVVVHVRELHDLPSLALSGRPASASFGHALAAGAPRWRPEAEGGDVDELERLEDAGRVPPAAAPNVRREHAGTDDGPDRAGPARRTRTR